MVIPSWIRKGNLRNAYDLPVVDMLATLYGLFNCGLSIQGFGIYAMRICLVWLDDIIYDGWNTNEWYPRHVIVYILRLLKVWENYNQKAQSDCQNTFSKDNAR